MRMAKIGVAVLLFLGSLNIGFVFGADAARKSEIFLGRTSEDPIKERERLNPLVEYLASRLKDMGIQKGGTKLFLPKENDKLLKSISDGSLDLILDSAYPSWMYAKKSGATPLLLAQKEGIVEYNAYIFVRKDSGIRSIEDLRGKKIAFEDAGSTSSYFLPRYAMRQKGLDIVPLESFHLSVPDGKTGYVFAGSELNVSSWVFYKKVDAGVLNCSDWDTLEETPENYRQNLEIIYETQKIPRMLISIGPNVDKALAARIKQELLAMDSTPEGRKVLKIYKLDRFIDPATGFKPVFDLIEGMAKEIGDN